MRFIEQAKSMDKPRLYDSYQRLLPNFKHYNKVTRGTMAKEIVANYLEDNGYLSSIITENELTIIKDIITGKNEFEDLDDIARAIKFQNKCLLYGDDTEDRFYIYDEFLKADPYKMSKVELSLKGLKVVLW